MSGSIVMTTNSSSDKELSRAYEAPPPSPLRIFLYIICTVGILLNVAVFLRRKYTSKRQGPATRISLQLLCVMAAADTLSLLALFIMLCTQYMGVSSRFIMDIACKIDLFVIHASSAFSVWCWLILSAIRYVAVYRPYTHLRMSREPLLGIIFIAVMCITFESWILFSVSYIPEIKGCGEMMPAERGKTLQLIEILWSYFIPVAAIIVLDSKAVCCRSEWWEPTVAADLRLSISSRPSLTANRAVSMDETSNENSDRKRSNEDTQQSFPSFDSKKVIATEKLSRKSIQQTRIIRRCLFITVIDLTMNLPNYLLRLYFNLSTDDEFPFIFTVVEEISHILYFAQFAMNAIYLICIIYDTPRHRTNTGTRQRSSSGVSLCELLPAKQHQYQQKKISVKLSPPPLSNQ